MAPPINAPMAGEIWHLSIEDLFQPLHEAPRLGGEGPFVINLSASTAPIGVPTKAFIDGPLEAHVYQIQVTEDGRTRYRLRLGPFACEDAADAILAEVRDTYPGALTATASAADLRVIATLQAKAAHRPTPRPPDLVIDAALPVADVPEISIDIAWPTPELGVSPNTPVRAAPTPAPPPAVRKSDPPPVAASIAPKPQWELPEMDVPLPTIQRQPSVPVASIAKQAEAPPPAAEPFELKIAPPYSSLAPVLTEVVTPTKAPRHQNALPKPESVAAPVLTEAVAPKVKAPPVPAAASAPLPAANTPASLKVPPQHEIAPPAKKAIAPAPKQNVTAPPQPAPPKSAAPLDAAKAAPVLTQSVATARKGWPKFRASSAKPLPNKLTSLQHVVVATAAAPAPREVKKLDEPLESLESTQTIRALTPMELEDNAASRWFVIQLALADHAFDPDAVPNLDIFSEYRLYSVAGLDQGRVVHALRLGFFREEIGAVAVASYLAAYWDHPTIKRVSLAERGRFADQRVEARKDVGATGKHAVIEITDELVARRRRSTKGTAAETPNGPAEH